MIKTINYLSSLVVPGVFFIVLFFGIKERIKVYDVFIKGIKEGVEIVIGIFPSVLALFIAVGLLRKSGIMETISIVLSKFLLFFNIPSEIVPLVLLRPISGSTSIAIATDIMKNTGVDSLTGKMASVIMGSTETTLYVITIYTNYLKTKNTKKILACALFADLVGITVSIIICNLLF